MTNFIYHGLRSSVMCLANVGALNPHHPHRDVDLRILQVVHWHRSLAPEDTSKIKYKHIHNLAYRPSNKLHTHTIAESTVLKLDIEALFALVLKWIIVDCASIEIYEPDFAALSRMFNYVGCKLKSILLFWDQTHQHATANDGLETNMATEGGLMDRERREARKNFTRQTAHTTEARYFSGEY